MRRARQPRVGEVVALIVEEDHQGCRHRRRPVVVRLGIMGEIPVDVAAGGVRHISVRRAPAEPDASAPVGWAWRGSSVPGGAPPDRGPQAPRRVEMSAAIRSRIFIAASRSFGSPLRASRCVPIRANRASIMSTAPPGKRERRTSRRQADLQRRRRRAPPRSSRRSGGMAAEAGASAARSSSSVRSGTVNSVIRGLAGPLAATGQYPRQPKRPRR